MAAPDFFRRHSRSGPSMPLAWHFPGLHRRPVPPDIRTWRGPVVLRYRKASPDAHATRPVPSDPVSPHAPQPLVGRKLPSLAVHPVPSLPPHPTQTRRAADQDTSTTLFEKMLPPRRDSFPQYAVRLRLMPRLPRYRSELWLVLRP